MSYKTHACEALGKVATSLPTVAYQCGPTAIYKSSTGPKQFCFVEKQASTTGVRAQDICQSLGYSVAYVGNIDRATFMWANSPWMT